MSVNVTSKRNSAGEVTIAGTMVNDTPTGYTLPVGAVDNENGTCSIMTAGGGSGGATEVEVLGAGGATSSTATVAAITTTGTIAAGKIHIQFDMDAGSQVVCTGGIVGTLLGSVKTSWVFDAPPGAPYGEVAYTPTVTTYVSLTTQ